MDIFFTVIADVVILLTLPLHCRYLYVMLGKDAKISSLEYPFRAALTNLVIANLIYSVVFILIQEPAAYGLFSDFYKNNAWWLGKIAIMQSVPLILFTALIHFLIGINRVSALARPMEQQQFWSERLVRRTLLIFWAVTIVECIPLVYPIVGSHILIVSPARSEGISFVIVGSIPNLAYQGIAVGIGGLVEIITIILYVFVVIRVRKMKNLPHSTITTTIAATFVSTGGILVIFVVLPDILVARLTGNAIWRQNKSRSSSDEMFYALFKLSNAYNNAVAPWVMLFQYRAIRRLLIGRQRWLLEPRRVTATNVEPRRQNRSL